MKNHTITVTLTLAMLLTACAPGAGPPTATSPPTTAPTQPPPEPTFTPTLPPEPTFTPTPIPEGWLLIETAHSPSPRTGHAMTMLPDGRVLLFGGRDADGNFLGDTWALDDWNNIDPSNPPAPRKWATITNVNGHVYLWGGEKDNGEPNHDIYEFKDNQWQKVTPANNPPPPRSRQRSWAYDDKMYVQGGIGAKDANGNLTVYNDLWVYDPKTNTWTQLADPPDFISPYAQPLVTGKTAVLLDTHSATSWNPGKSYDYDMDADRWHEVRMEGLPTDGEHSRYGLVQIDNRRAIMFGGSIWNPDTQEELPSAEVWLAKWHPESNTVTWKRLDDMPVTLYEAGAINDPVHHRIIVFGGLDSAEKYFSGTLCYYPPAEQTVNRYLDGSQEETKADGTVVTTFGALSSLLSMFGVHIPAGSQMTENPDGSSQLKIGSGGGDFPGWDHLPEGTVVKTLPDGTTVVTEPDGTVITSLGWLTSGGMFGVDIPAGTQFTDNPDGTRQIKIGSGGADLPGWDHLPEGTVVKTLPDGTTKVTEPDGTVTTSFGWLTAGGMFGADVPAGSKRTEYPDGTTDLDIGPGGADWPGWGHLPEGTVVETLPDGTTEVTKPDGTVTTSFGWLTTGFAGSLFGDIPAGSQMTENPDGSSHLKIGSGGADLPGWGQLPEGTVVKKSLDGTITVTKPDGSVIRMSPDGASTETNPDGTAVTTFSTYEGIPAGTQFTERPDGTIKMRVGQGGLDLPGQGLTLWPEGTVVTLDQEGTVTVTKPDGTVEVGQMTPSIARLFRTLQRVQYQAQVGQ